MNELFDLLMKDYNLDLSNLKMNENGIFRASAGEFQFICSPEFIQDLAIYDALANTPKTKPATKQEIAEWKAAEKQLKEMDWKGAYRRVKIKREFVPYEETDI